MQLALGDAMAVSLLEAKGFTAGDFYTFHPGGQLGANLAHVCRGHAHRRIGAAGSVGHSGAGCNHDVVSAKVRLCRVTDATGRLIGIVTDGDVARNLGKNLVNQPIDAIMTANPKTIAPTALASTAMAILNNNEIGALIVTDQSQMPLGIVHFHDLLRIGVA
jgi:arabinose-5-phosphate isomerase